MKNISKLVSVILTLTMIFALAGCGAKEEKTGATDTKMDDTQTEASDILIGDITVSGSTSVEKIGVASGDEFMALNPGATFTYEGIGSSGGVKNANEKVTNIGAASRNLQESEKAYGLTEVIIAYDGIAVIVHPSNEVQNLTLPEVQAIYKGEITNWNEVGGADQEISLVSREDGSGTRGAFEELVGFEDVLSATALLKDGNGNVQTTIAANPNAIGYVSFTYLDESIKGVQIDGTEPTVENVLNESYPISRPFLMMYHEDNMNNVAKAYIEFLLSNEGQDIVEANGGIRVN
jgi:phosphate transport system substrate-binding protein